MGIAAALLAEYNNLTATRNWVVNQLLVANNKYDANAAQLAKLQEYDKKYQGYVEDAMDGKELKYRGEILNYEECYCDRDEAEEIASIMVPQYDEENLDLCLETDNYYETLKNTLKAQEDLLKTQIDYVKQKEQEATQDSPVSSGG